MYLKYNKLKDEQKNNKISTISEGIGYYNSPAVGNFLQWGGQPHFQNYHSNNSIQPTFYPSSITPNCHQFYYYVTPVNAYTMPKKVISPNLNIFKYLNRKTYLEYHQILNYLNK